MNQLWVRQIGGVLRLELKKTFLSRRGWWVYLLALGPVALTLLHWLLEMGSHSNRHSIGEDSLVFAGLFHFYFLRLGIFFGCVGIFPTSSAVRCWKKRCTTISSRPCAASFWWPANTWPAWPPRWSCSSAAPRYRS